MFQVEQSPVLVWLRRSCVFAAVILAGAYTWWLWPRAPAAAAKNGQPVPAAEFQPGPHFAGNLWNVFAPSAGSAAGIEGTEALSPARLIFRLAGTFFAFADSPGGAEERKAILDDLKVKNQIIIGQGEEAEGWTLRLIAADHVLLARGSDTEKLTMDFGSQKTSATEGVPLEPGEKILKQTPFGALVATNRWDMSREALMNYYQTVLENPERIAAVYQSLKPVYRGKDITGYQLDEVGEQDFFKDVGLQQGDVITKVNSMSMSSQDRAEYFLGEFVKDRLDAVVIDLERDNQPQKMIYLIK